MLSVAFQAQLSSIMEGLTKAAVAEVSKLVEEGYAELRLQISRSHTENQTLKEELRKARGGQQPVFQEPDKESGRDKQHGIQQRALSPLICSNEAGPAGQIKTEKEFFKEEKPEAAPLDMPFLQWTSETDLKMPGCFIKLENVSGCYNEEPNVSGLASTAEEQCSSGLVEETASASTSHSDSYEVPFNPDQQLMDLGHLSDNVEKKSPFFCSYCGKVFNYFPYLKKHLITHTKEKPFSCSQCEKTFGRRDYLKKHLLMHTGEKPFSCSHCDKSFTSSSYLKQHRFIHTGEKPFGCTQCVKRFLTSSDLRKHLVVHTKERPHVCTQCGKCFSLVSRLKTHQRIHFKSQTASSIKG